MDLNRYQKKALRTSHYVEAGDPTTAIASVLGLGGSAGIIFNLYKRYFNDQTSLKDHKEFLRRELGDLLWYVAVVAQTVDLGLDQIAQYNLIRIQDRYGKRRVKRQTAYEKGVPIVERFPSRLVVKFSEKRRQGRIFVSLTLVEATPNAFPNGQIKKAEQKPTGYTIGMKIGADLNDNSRYADDYRYHDAIHLGFLAVLNWSPIWRELLAVKRKSKGPQFYEAQDGARAKFLEEGLAAILFRLSKERRNFSEIHTVDGGVLDIVQALVKDLEVESASLWLWRYAIQLGFKTFADLAEHRGGFVIADLKQQTLTYNKMYPQV
jgi:hypothetical protein